MQPVSLKFSIHILLRNSSAHFNVHRGIGCFGKKIVWSWARFLVEVSIKIRTFPREQWWVAGFVSFSCKICSYIRGYLGHSGTWRRVWRSFWKTCPPTIPKGNGWTLKMMLWTWIFQVSIWIKGKVQNCYRNWEPDEWNKIEPKWSCVHPKSLTCRQHPTCSTCFFPCEHFLLEIVDAGCHFFTEAPGLIGQLMLA